MADFAWHHWLLNRRQVTQTTVDVYELAIVRVERFAGKHRDALVLEDVERFLQGPASNQSKHLSLVAIRIRHKWGAARGLWPYDPELMEIRLRKRRKPVLPTLTDNQATDFLSNALGPVEKRVAFLGLYTGLRLAEIVAVDVGAWRDRVIRVPTKGGSDIQVPCHPNLMREKVEILSDRPTRDQLVKACKRLGKRSGVPQVSSQWLRRTFSQRLRKLGVQDSVIDALLGHASSSVLHAHYAPVTWEEMKVAIDHLNYGMTPQLSFF